MLERLYRSYAARRLEFDPLRFPRRYARADDREIVAWVAAALAYGNARTILSSVSRILDVLGPAPAAFLKNVRPRELSVGLADFRHRLTTGRDVAGLSPGRPAGNDSPLDILSILDSGSDFE